MKYNMYCLLKGQYILLLYGKYTHTPYQFRCCRKLVQMKERCYNPAPDFSSLFSQLKQGQCTSRPRLSSIFLHSKAKSLSESITQWSYHCISVLCKHCCMQLCGQVCLISSALTTNENQMGFSTVWDLVSFLQITHLYAGNADCTSTAQMPIQLVWGVLWQNAILHQTTQVQSEKFLLANISCFQICSVVIVALFQRHKSSRDPFSFT